MKSTCNHHSWDLSLMELCLRVYEESRIRCAVIDSHTFVYLSRQWILETASLRNLEFDLLPRVVDYTVF